ncbi:MAG: DUF2723 domain-containing protein [Chloroflexi bacterium]|nr:DUF2723 domain-containing protein [Chloroflexota bacterium]
MTHTKSAFWWSLGIFGLIFAVLLATVAPTIYTLVDSSEYAIGAYTLGIVHAPGYPLYLLLARLFTWLPVGTIAYRVNLMSAVALALAGVFLFNFMLELTGKRWLALAGTLLTLWSYNIWVVGVAAEVYAPELAALSAFAWALACCGRQKSERLAVLAGALYGLTVALNPTAIFLVLGVLVAFLMLPLRWHTRLLAGALAIVIFVLPLIYFPIRYQSNPVFNAAGVYNASGAFIPVNLTTLDGIWWLVSGKMFNSLFFSEGIIPTLPQITDTFNLFWGNFLIFGAIFGLLGLGWMFRQRRRLLIVWAGFFVPYVYFYTTYGAVDRDTMFGPALFAWTLPFVFGLEWLTREFAPRWRAALVLVLVLVPLLINFPLVNASRDTSNYQHGETMSQRLPTNAVVMGNWLDIITLQYLQLVEGQRPDLTLYNTFYFPIEPFDQFIRQTMSDGQRPVVLLNLELDDEAKIEPLLDDYQARPELDNGSVLFYRLAQKAPAS